MSKLDMEKSWLNILRDEFDRDYMKTLKSFLVLELENKKVIYPHGKDIFNAFNYTPFHKVKAIILGQDPYHGPNQAHGLAFSVQRGVRTPPSLVNIYKELHEDLGVKIPKHGYLKSWADEGVLLLNTVLTVENGKAGSHRKKGWENFTDQVIKVLNEKKENIVFILWGAPAQKK